MKAWILAARPKTLMAAVAPVLIGGSMAFADEAFHALSFFIAMLGAILIQIGTNFCNDFFDFKQGADTETRQGPTRAVQAGLITEKAMLRATILMFTLVLLCCAYLILRAGWPILAIGIASILSGIWYTAGRYSLAYLGIAEVFVIAFFGLIAVGGTYYVQVLEINRSVILAGLAPGLLSTGLLALNNLRDVDQDRLVNKNTLAVRLGRGFARTEYILCVCVAVCVPVLLVLLERRGPFALAACLILFPAIPVFKVIRTGTTGAELNPMLGKTAKLLLLYSVLFSVGWAL